jgi:hypothetical protein
MACFLFLFFTLKHKILHPNLHPLDTTANLFFKETKKKKKKKRNTKQKQQKELTETRTCRLPFMLIGR